MCVAILGSSTVWAEEEMMYEYGDDGIVNESLELEISAEANKTKFGV